MEFGWINLFGAGIVLLILVPNIVYSGKTKKRNKSPAGIPRLLSVCEQTGRYGCIAFMWLPLFVWKFGFSSPLGLISYLLLNSMLLISYYLLWFGYFKKKTAAKAMALAVIPSAMFLLSGMLLRHWCLAGFALLFGYAHCRITCITHLENKDAPKENKE